MKQLGEIRISGRSSGLTIDIEGIIGIPEWWQFDTEDERVATYAKFREKIQELGAVQAQKITVNIRSVGGNVQDALLIYDTLGGLRAEITTACYGYVASAATVIAQAASEGRRFISANALYLVHNCTTALEGNSQDAERTAKLLGKTDERIAAIYAGRSGRPAEEFRELMARDSGRGEWLSPEETVTCGLADKITGKSPLATVRERVRNLFGRSGQAVSNAVLQLLEPGEKAGREIETAGSVVALAEQVDALQQKVEKLDRDNAQLRARPSATLPKEDPAIVSTFGLEEMGIPANHSAYEGDVKQFHTGY